MLEKLGILSGSQSKWELKMTNLRSLGKILEGWALSTLKPVDQEVHKPVKPTNVYLGP